MFKECYNGSLLEKIFFFRCVWDKHKQCFVKFSVCNTHTVTSDSCSLVRFSGWLMAVMPYSFKLAPGGRLARRMALFATFMKTTMACHPLLLNHTWRKQQMCPLFICETSSVNYDVKQDCNNLTLTLFSVSMYFKKVPNSFRASVEYLPCNNTLCKNDIHINKIIIYYALIWNKNV